MNAQLHQRTLSKSDFKLARTCPAKLYFRENGYPDNRASNPYLALLANGGYMVEALAKARYANGIHLEYGRDPAAGLAATLDHLQRDTVTLFEATLQAGRRLARVDILEKRGTQVRLLEVKSKSFAGAEHFASLTDGGPGVFRGKRRPHDVLAIWRDYLEDVAFQTDLLSELRPDLEITPYLVLVDTTKRSALDVVPSLFRLEQRAGRDGTVRTHTARYRGTLEQLAQLDLLTEVDVSAEVGMVRDEVAAMARDLEQRLDAPLHDYLQDISRDSRCTGCEFRHDDPAVKSGFADCWGDLARPTPHVLELHAAGSAKAPDRSGLIEWMVHSRRTGLLDVPLEGLTKADGSVGPQAERQRRQIEFTRRNERFVSPELAGRIAALREPLHFLDFETSRLALPYHARMRPYGLVTFQWSCHSPSPGGSLAQAEWLNMVDVWPNQAFAESLRAAIGDTGAVLTWSHYEAAVLNEIVRDLADFGRDAGDLADWMMDVVQHRIVDLHEWAKTDYWTPGMRGRTSIKVVLDAIWKSDPEMRRQFTTWSGLPAGADRDPYSSLPPVEINGTLRDVHEGTGAMEAYQEMMYGADRDDAAIRERWATLLRQYCKLDTLAMVLILEHWRRISAPTLR